MTTTAGTGLEQLLHEAERRSEQALHLARGVLWLVLALAAWLTFGRETLPQWAFAPLFPLWLLSIAVAAATWLAVWRLVTARRYRPWLKYVLILADALVWVVPAIAFHVAAPGLEVRMLLTSQLLSLVLPLNLVVVAPSGALRWSRRPAIWSATVAAAAEVALGLLLALDLRAWLMQLAVIAFMGGVGIAAARGLRRLVVEHAELQRLQTAHRVAQELAQQELAHARAIQEDLLRQIDQAPAGVEVDAICRPATEVGGDFYDVLDLGHGQVAVVVGDVCGHGIAAALLAVNARPKLHAALIRHRTPGRALTEVNQKLSALVAPGTFVCVACVVLNVRTGEGELANGGAVTPLLKRHNGTLVHLETVGPRLPLGIDPALTYEARPVHLSVGDHLLLYTDGVVETQGAQAGSAGLFGFERLEAIVAKLPAQNAAALSAGILAAVEAHQVGPQQDDVTVLVLRRDGSGIEDHQATADARAVQAR